MFLDDKFKFVGTGVDLLLIDPEKPKGQLGPMFIIIYYVMLIFQKKIYHLNLYFSNLTKIRNRAGNSFGKTPTCSCSAT